MQRSWVVGFLEGFHLWKLAEWKMWSEGGRWTKTSLRVAQKKAPTVAVPPMVVSLRNLRMMPMVMTRGMDGCGVE